MNLARNDNPANWRLPRRLAYVVSHARPWSSNGYAARTHAVARALTRAGHEVIVFTRPGRPWDIENFPAHRQVVMDQHIDGVRHVCLPLAPIPGATPTARLRARADVLTEAFYVFRPGAVLAASNWETAEPARRAAGRMGATFFYEQRGFWEMGAAGPEAAGAARHETDIAMAARAVFTLNDAMRDELVRRGVPEGRIELVPNGLSRPGRIDARITRASLCCTARFVLGYIGSLSAYEGVETLIDLVARLRAGTDGTALDVAALIVGSDAPKGLVAADAGTGQNSVQGAEAILRAHARRSGVGAHVHFVPQQPEDRIDSYYALCDALVMPRKRTAVTECVPPIKPYAGAAHGLPVFMTDLPPLAKIATEIHGSVFPEGDLSALADMVRQALLHGHPATVATLDPALDWDRRVAPILRHLAHVAQTERGRNARLFGDLSGALPKAAVDTMPEPAPETRFDMGAVPGVALRDTMGSPLEARIGPVPQAGYGGAVTWLTRATLLEVLATAEPGRFVIDWAGLRAAPDSARGDWTGLWSIDDMRLNRQIMDAVRIGLDRGWTLQVIGPVQRSEAPLFRSVASVMEEILPAAEAQP